MKVEKVLTITRKERKEMIRIRKDIYKRMANFYGVKRLAAQEGLFEFNFEIWLASITSNKQHGSEQFTEIYKFLESHVFNCSNYKETMIGYLIRNLGDRHYERRGIFNSKILINRIIKTEQKGE